MPNWEVWQCSIAISSFMRWRYELRLTVLEVCNQAQSKRTPWRHLQFQWVCGFGTAWILMAVSGCEWRTEVTAVKQILYRCIQLNIFRQLPIEIRVYNRVASGFVIVRVRTFIDTSSHGSNHLGIKFPLWLFPLHTNTGGKRRHTVKVNILGIVSFLLLTILITCLCDPCCQFRTVKLGRF